MVIFILPIIFTIDNEQNAFFLAGICKKPPPKRGRINKFQRVAAPDARVYSVKPSKRRHQVYLLMALCTALPQ